MSAPVYGKTVKRQVKNSTQWLLISDSYAITPKEHVNATWPYQFIKYMGLKHNRFCLVKKSGYGYACKGKKFISLAKELKASRNIKTIIIMGGINNDKDCSLAMIKKAMKRLDKLLRKKYPNAQIYIGMPNYASASDPERVARVTARKPKYQKFAQSLGWIYLTNVSTVLEKNTDWWIEDNHHPNEKGGELIAKELYSCFRKSANTYKVQFNANGGEGSIRNRYYKKDITYKLPANHFKREGYIFSGWHFKNTILNDSAKIKNLAKRGKTVTLTASWTRIIGFTDFEPILEPETPQIQESTEAPSETAAIDSGSSVAGQFTSGNDGTN